MKKPGRPKKKKAALRVKLSIYVTRKLAKKWRARAARAGLQLSPWVVSRVLGSKAGDRGRRTETA